jgi:hypothetical protein
MKLRRSPGAGTSLCAGEILACPETGAYGELLCPRDLNTETGEISPDRGKSCNKSNTSRRERPAIPLSVRCLLSHLACPWRAAGAGIIIRAADSPRYCAVSGSSALRVLTSWAVLDGPGYLL